MAWRGNLAVRTQPVVGRARAEVRKWRRQLDNPEVRAGRLLLSQLREAPVDVLHFGSSESLFVSPTDSDTRTLPQLLDASLSPEISLFSTAGAGYHPRLIAAYLDLVASQPARPVVVVSLCVRLAFPAWSAHPFYGYERALLALRSVDPRGPLWRIRANLPGPTGAQFATHDQMPYPTIAGDLTIGDYRRPLLNPAASGLSDSDAVRLLYAFHHGGVLADVTDGWRSGVVQLARTLRDHGFPAVIYPLPIPIEEGTRLHGPEFRSRATANSELLSRVFADAYPGAVIVDTGTRLGTDGFLDPTDATEHYNQLGRHWLVDAITPPVGELLARQRER